MSKVPDEVKALARQAFENYRRPNGSIEWTRIKTEHPDWEAPLTYPGVKAAPFLRGTHIIKAMVKRGELEGAVAAKNGTHGGKRPVTAAFRRKMANAAKIRWAKRKAAGHADLSDRPTVGRTRKGAYATQRETIKVAQAAKMEQRAFFEGFTEEQKQWVNRLVEKRGREMAEEMQERSALNFCPRCGNNLQATRMASSFAAKLA